MTKLLLTHTRDILAYVYNNRLTYRIPIYFKQEHAILNSANYIEIQIPEKLDDMTCKFINLYKENELPVKPKNLE